MFNVISYKNRNGKSEVEEYILSLQTKEDKSSKVQLQKIVSYINMLAKYGTNLGMPYIRYIDNGIWELRPLRNRTLFAYWKDNTFLLLNIFMKKTQKIPEIELGRAKRMLKDFIRRNKDNG